MGFQFPVANNPGGKKMVEQIPRFDSVSLPGNAILPQEQVDAALAQLKMGFAEITKELNPGDGVPLHWLERQAQQQQQQ
jgi:hypothetical protein